MSVLVWVMGDGEHQDMIATCRTDDGKWLTIRWDYREFEGMIAFQHDNSMIADNMLTSWTQNLEGTGSVMIAAPKELYINPPYRADEHAVMAWWNHEFKDAVMEMVLDDPADLDWDEECTLDLPAEDPGQILIADMYSAKLAWGP